MDLVNLPVDVGGIVVRGTLSDEQRCDKKEREDRGSVHRDTIAECRVIC